MASLKTTILVSEALDQYGKRKIMTSEEKSRYELKSLASLIRNLRRALSADELAGLLSISRITILRRAKLGKIPSFRIGGLVRFDSAAISEWLLNSGVKSMSRR